MSAANDERRPALILTNSGARPAVMIKLMLQDAALGSRIPPAYYSDNYISLPPGEQRTITVEFPWGNDKAGFSLRAGTKTQIVEVQ